MNFKKIIAFAILFGIGQISLDAKTTAELSDAQANQAYEAIENIWEAWDYDYSYFSAAAGSGNDCDFHAKESYINHKYGTIDTQVIVRSQLKIISAIYEPNISLFKHYWDSVESIRLLETWRQELEQRLQSNSKV